MQSHVARLFAPLSLSVLLLATPLFASAATYYVATTGSDSNAGTQSAPFKTINKAASVAVAGTVVHVAPGTYSGNVTTSANGTASNRIKYVSDTKWGAKIVGSGTESMWTNDGNYTDIVDFDITGPGRLGILNWASYTLISGNHVHNLTLSGGCTDNGGAGIVNANYSGSDGDIIGNVVHDIGVPGGCNGVHGIYSSNLRGHIYNNIVYRVSAFGIHLWHAATDVIIANNTSFANGSSNMGGGMVIGDGDSPGGIVLNNTKVINNIIYNNPGSSIREYCYPGENCIGSTNTIANNLVYGNGSGISLIVGSAVGTVTANPQFVNYLANGTGDYHLQSTSPAIDKGTSADAPTTDLDGNTRPQGAAYDIGAYEYGTSPSPSSGPVGWWKFDETSGTTASDASGNNHPGTLVSTPTWTTGKVGGALSFNGTTQYVTFGDNVDLDGSDITLSIWVKPDAIADYIPFIDKLSSGGNYRLVGYADGKVQYGIRNTANGYDFIDSATGVLKVGTWTHIAVVHTNATNQATLYINGTAVGTKAFAIPRRDTTEPLKSGYNANNATYYKGLVDDMRIYNRVLSASEVQSLYNVAPPADTTAPSVPTGLTATATSSQINLTWTASTDNVGVTGYKIFRDGVQVGTSATNSFSNAGLAASTVYSYTVASYDVAGNTSAQSAAVNAITGGATAQVISVGSRVITTANLNVRSAASPSSAKIGTEPVGSLGTVIGGPTTANGHNWWQVKWDDGLSGWSIGNYLAVARATSSPALGIAIPAPSIATLSSADSLVEHILQQVYELTGQIRQLQAQLAAAGVIFTR